MDILKTIQEQREEFNALPTLEKIKKNRERRVASLLRVGYITPDEAQTYREQLTELPTDRKGLVVAYYLLGIDTIPSTEESKRIAETFVDAKRNRIRAKLLQLQTILIAISLVENEQESELDAIPYLRDQLQERGYRDKAKNLNDVDKEAIQGAASHYLDLLELAFLNGVGLLRNEEYKDYLSEDGERWEKEFIYRDAYDEALTEFGSTYLLLDNVVCSFYTDGTAKGAIDFLSKYYKDIFEESSYFTETIKGTKFNYLMEEEKQC